ncbi:hypothetical protein HPB50_019126 [Hyalomma asiaticum]|uniref:Uncharacterized protein n=1 Tax=Hyalomma asiaticum TaxID=266040 RepID=A0ACB7SJH8_HYAAI|nr:hypothetical protein HPB50_019126 [Hyalomma asiaticum]
MRDNEEYPLADSKVIVTSYSCGPLDAAYCDMGSVAEEQLDGSHQNVMVTSESGEDGDVACGTQAVSQDSERHSEEFTDAIGCFESKGDELPAEKGFGSYERIGEVHEEVTVPLDDHGGCRAASEREVGTIKCLSPVGDTCGAVMVECHADDLVVREGSSQDDANGVYSSEEENSARVLLLAFAVEQIEVLVPYAGVPEVDVGFKAREFLRNIADVNASSAASSGMKEGAVRRMHGYEKQFVKLDLPWSRLITPFDYTSVMLYGSSAFAIDKDSPTMLKKNGEKLEEVYKKERLSSMDNVRLEMLYKTNL